MATQLPTSLKTIVKGHLLAPTYRICPSRLTTLRANEELRQWSSAPRAPMVLAPHHRRVPGRLPLHVPYAGAAIPESPSANLTSTLKLGALFGGWYLANICFNIYNKQVLMVFPYPLTCTTLQFAVGGCIAGLFWLTGLVSRPTITGGTLLSILPLAAVHTLGNLLTNLSLGAVAVSFTHTIKAMEPFFSVILSAIFLGEKPSLAVVLCLLPIVGGVALASVTEATFNWKGFLAAMGSNLTFQSRNVLSKKFMISKGGLDNINLFSIMSIMSFFILLPVALTVDGWLMTPSTLQSLGITDAAGVLQRMLLAGVCFHLYQQLSYMILQQVSPVTHSIGNCVKRVVVIVASVLVFGNAMSTQNQIGTAIALAGVFCYARFKKKPAPPEVKTS